MDIATQVRLWIESRTILYDDTAGTKTVFYQCGSCKSENTFGSSDLFNPDNYDFCPVFGGGAGINFRRFLPGGPSGNDIAKYKDVYLFSAGGGWGHDAGSLRLWPATGAQELTIGDFDAIRDATAADLPIVAQTEIKHPTSGLRAVIEYPVKTMNILREDSMADQPSAPVAAGVWQTDTGPLLVPDLSRRFEPAIECMSLGFVAANNRQPEAADFVLEQPTSIGGGREVLHYSQPFSMPAINRLFALPLPAC